MQIESPEAVFTRWRPMMLSIALRILHHHEDAEDCVQDAMVLIVERWGQMRESESASSWVHQVVRSVALTMLRKRKAPKRGGGLIPLDELHEAFQPASRSHEGPVLARLALESACGRMNERTAEVVRLWIAGGKPEGPISVSLRVLRFRTLRELRAILKAAPVRRPGRMKRLPQ